MCTSTKVSPSMNLLLYPHALRPSVVTAVLGLQDLASISSRTASHLPFASPGSDHIGLFVEPLRPRIPVLFQGMSPFSLPDRVLLCAPWRTSFPSRVIGAALPPGAGGRHCSILCVAATISGILGMWRRFVSSRVDQSASYPSISVPWLL